MRRTVAVCLLAALLGLAGCSSSDGGKPAVPTPSATTSAPAASPTVDDLAACTDAIVAGGDSDSPECASLSADAYLKALRAANQRGRDALESAIASASAADR